MMTERDWEQAAQQLFEVYEKAYNDEESKMLGTQLQGHRWEDQSRLHRLSWIAVAKVVAQASSDLIRDLFYTYGDPTLPVPEQPYTLLDDIIRYEPDHR